MTDYPFAQIDAFASKPFEGNRACVLPMDVFLPDPVLQAIAEENNVSETAYIVPAGEGRWQLRWFTPGAEVPLCGHATLAAAHWLFEHGGYGGEAIAFETRHAGVLTVTRADRGRLAMDFPAAPGREVPVTDAMAEVLGARPAKVFEGRYMAALFERPEDITALEPDLEAIEALETGAIEPGCVGCLAPGGEGGADVTSRFFAPSVQIPEDPATGSWHCMVAPLMAGRLGKTALDCYQAYPGRGGWIGTDLAGDRVMLYGRSVTVIEGTFRL